MQLGPGIWAAIKADTICISAFEVSLFGWMTPSHYALFSPPLGANRAAFWFPMQVGMMIGFASPYPANVWLLPRGLTKKMPAEPNAAPQSGPPKPG